MNIKATIGALLGAGVIVLSLAACSGGGGGGGGGAVATRSVISGTVAAGAPVIGTVTVKDSIGATKTSTIQAGGKYSLDVTGMAGPFLFRAIGSVGGQYIVLTSAATSDDVGKSISITPFTDLIVANIAGTAAEKYFNENSPSAAKFSTAELNAAKDALTARLKPVLDSLGVVPGFDLLRTAFVADHTGIDKALDIVKVMVNPDTATAVITNIVTSQQIADDLASKSDNSVISAPPAGTDLSAVVTELQAIEGQLSAFGDLFKASAPSSVNPALIALFVPSGFKNEGMTLDGFLAPGQLQERVGVTPLNPVIIQRISSTRLKIGFAVKTIGGVAGGEFEFWKNASTGTWQIAGDQAYAKHNFAPVVSRQPNWADMTTNLPVGNVYKRFLDLGAASGDASIYRIKVEGVGLPTLGVNLLRSNQVGSSSRFDVEGVNANAEWLPECEPGQVPNDETPPSPFQSDQCVDFTNIAAATVYTFTYYDANGAQVGQPFSKQLAASPVNKTDAEQNFSKWFATITGVTPSIPAGLINNASINIGWIPPGDVTFSVSKIWFDWGGVIFSKDSASSSLISPISVGAWSGEVPTVTQGIYGGVGIVVRDPKGRVFSTQDIAPRL